MGQVNTDIKGFISDHKCLVVEPSSAFSSSIQTCLTGLGLANSQILMARRFEDAKRMIKEFKPKLVIAEYDLGSGLGLSLMEAQAEYYPDEMSRISIIVTKNSSDSAIAEAAEEQVDAYILKPFSIDSFNEKLLDVFNRKMNPSAYMQRIRVGKGHFSLAQFQEAVNEFLAAKTLDEKPTLACFYAGQAYQALGNKSQALAEFKEGRKYQPLHYKCLIGEFENLMEGHKYKEAYALVEIISRNYPLTSHRLGQFFIAAVFTYNFDILPHLYQTYLKLDQRSPKLTQLTTTALMTAGRYWINKNSMAKALEYFEMGITAANRDFDYVERIVNEFLNVKALNEARIVFAKASSSKIGTAAHNRLDFKVSYWTLPKNQVIDKGRKLVTEREATPEIYILLIKLLVEEGKNILAESIASKAIQSHPEMRAELYKLLEVERLEGE